MMKYNYTITAKRKSPEQRQRQMRTPHGFTLVEMLVIAPVAILAIGAFIALMISMVGSVMITRDRDTLAYNVQDALSHIEQDTHLSTQFMASSGTLPSPQGSNDSTAAFTSSSALILSTYATDKNPTNPARQLVYYAKQPNPCGTKQNTNRLLLVRSIYFVKNGSLWRRTIVPPYNTNATPDANTVCSAAWQRNSCSPGYASSSLCETNDMEVMKNVDSFSVQYYSKPGDPSPLPSSQADNASTVQVTINGKVTTTGEPITTSGMITATKVGKNMPIATPAVSTDLSVPNAAIFRWNQSPGASSYLISYSVNGGSWINTTADVNTSTFQVNASGSDTVTFKIAAKNDVSTSPYAVTTVTIPTWSTFSLNGWVDYGGWAVHGYTRTKDGVVLLKGLIKNGAASGVIGTLPDGFRPSEKLLFTVETNNDVAGRIDVQTNGDIVAQVTDPGWVGLDSIRFMAAGTPWNNLPLQSPWARYDSFFASAGYTKTADGLVKLKGLIQGGANGSLIGVLPAGYRPSERLLFAVETWANVNGRVDVLPTGEIYAVSASPNWVSLDNISFMPSGTSWTSLPLIDPWAPYPGYAAPAFTKTGDGIVQLKGLIRNGTSGSTIGFLPPGYRPKERLLFAVETNNQANGRIDVLPTGEIRSDKNDPGWAGLDNISFRAEQ